jgi:branched-subunit amino acid transport protein
MGAAEVWVVILGGMLATYSSRLSFIALPHPDQMPDLFRRGLRLVAPAVLSAILMPQVIVLAEGRPVFLGPRPLAAAIAGLIAWRTRNTWLAIGGGMIALWVFQAFGL